MFSDRLDRDASAFPSTATKSVSWIMSSPRSDQEAALHGYFTTLPFPSATLPKYCYAWNTNSIDRFNFSSFNTWDVLREREDVKTLMDAIWYKGNTHKSCSKLR